MKITKELKHATFEWDDSSKTFTLIDKDGNKVALNKVYAFAFMRFVVRMAQRNWFRNKKIVDKTTSAVVDLEDIEHCDQMFMFDDQ